MPAGVPQPAVAHFGWAPTTRHRPSFGATVRTIKARLTRNVTSTIGQLGQGMVEYALVVASVSVMLVGAFTLTPMDSVILEHVSDVAAAIRVGAPTSTAEADPTESPKSADDCKNGGYVKYGFKNQGRCIAWVNTNS